MLQPVRRALISVSDKSCATDLARALAARGIEILSTGGTARLLRLRPALKSALEVVRLETQSLEQSKDAVRSKISWLERDREDVAAWLKANGYA